MVAQLRSIVFDLDAPIEGWDAFSSIDNMSPTAAIYLDNIIPEAGSCVSRKGSNTYCDTGTGAPVETVASLSSGFGSTLMCASGNKIFDITNSVAVTEMTQESPITNDRWQVINFINGSGDPITIWCNGVNNARVYPDPLSGANDFADLVDTNAVGLNFEGGVVFKGRVMYWKAMDTKMWYAPPASFQGELESFDFGNFVQEGGNISFMTTWTEQDAGDGPDDFMVVVFDTGEVLIYRGEGPDPGLTWEQVGRYRIPAPLGPRGVSKFGTDTIIMTREGYVSLSTVAQQGRVSDVNQFSRRISSAITEATENKEGLFGWECDLFAAEGLMIFNVPRSNSTFQQHVLNTTTMRWCRFTGLNVTCMTDFHNRFFGGKVDGTVLELMVGTSDDGEAIQCSAAYAYNEFEAPGRNKHITAAQILSTHPEPSLIAIDALADYRIPRPTGEIPLSQGTDQDGLWANPPAPGVGKSEWNKTFWSKTSEGTTTKGWQNVSGYGYAVSIGVRWSRTNTRVIWRSTTLRAFISGSQ